MSDYAEKTTENKSISVADHVSLWRESNSVFQFVDNHPEAIAQREMQQMANNSPHVKQLRAYQEMGDNYQRATTGLVRGKPVQRMVIDYPGGRLDTDNVLTSMFGELSIPDLMAIISTIEKHSDLNKREEVRAKHVLRVAKTAFLKKGPGKELGLPPGGWSVSDAALGDAYLNARAARRPKMVNTHSLIGKEGTRNCSLVAAAAVLNRNSEDLYKELCPEPVPSPNESEDGLQQGPAPVPTTLAFLGEDAINYNEFGGMTDAYAAKTLGTLKIFKERRIAEGASGDSKSFLEEWANLKSEPPNAQIQQKMAAFVKKYLEKGVHVREGRSPSGMLFKAVQGIESMKQSPRGTQFIVFVKGDKESGAHYIYADNLGGDIHFYDYQPLGRHSDVGVTAADGTLAHPRNVNKLTPPPFNPGHAFTELSFIAFEINAGQIIEYLTKLYR